MRMRREATVAATVLLAVAGACGDKEPAKTSPFEITGIVQTADPGARPVNDPTNSVINGLILIREDSSEGFEECTSDVSGVSVFVKADTKFSPADAEDLARLRGDAVRVTGKLTKDDNDTCTSIADRLTVLPSDAPPEGSPATSPESSPEG